MLESEFRDAGLDPLQQRALVDAKLDDGIELDVLLLEQLIERFGLRHGARKAVEDESVRRVRLIEPVRNDPDHDLVRHQAAGGHDVLGLDADRRLRRHRGAQHFPGRELNDVVAVNQPLGLGSLARPWRPEKNQSHEYTPPGSVSD